MQKKGSKEIVLLIENKNGETRYRCQHADKTVFSNGFNLKVEVTPARVILQDVMFFFIVNKERQLHPHTKVFLWDHFRWNDPSNHFFSAMSLSPGMRIRDIQSRDRNPQFFTKLLFRDTELYRTQKDQLEMLQNSKPQNESGSNLTLNLINQTKGHFFHQKFNFSGKTPCGDYQAAGSYLPLIIFYCVSKNDDEWFLKKQQIVVKLSSTIAELEADVSNIFANQPISIPKEYCEALSVSKNEKTNIDESSDVEIDVDIIEASSTSPKKKEKPIGFDEEETETFGPFQTLDEAKAEFFKIQKQFKLEVEQFNSKFTSEVEAMQENYDLDPEFWQHWMFVEKKNQKRKRNVDKEEVDDENSNDYPCTPHTESETTFPGQQTSYFDNRMMEMRYCNWCSQNYQSLQLPPFFNNNQSFYSQQTPVTPIYAPPVSEQFGKEEPVPKKPRTTSLLPPEEFLRRHPDLF